MKKTLSLLLAAVMLIMALASCSKGSAGVKIIDINLTEEEYAFGVDKDQPELLAKANEFIAKIKSDGTLDKIFNNYFGDGTPKAVTSAELDESKDQLVVATNLAFAPFEYIEGESIYGIDMEVIELFAKELGKELVISNMEFEAVCLSVGQHKCDIAIAGLTVTESRKESLDFTESYYNASQQIIVKEDDTTFDSCKSAADVEAILSGFDASKNAGVQKGTTAQFYLEGDEEWGFEGYDLTCKGYQSGSLAVQDLINGNLDFVLIDSAPAAAIVESYNANK